MDVPGDHLNIPGSASTDALYLYTAYLRRTTGAAT